MGYPGQYDPYLDSPVLPGEQPPITRDDVLAIGDDAGTQQRIRSNEGIPLIVLVLGFKNIQIRTEMAFMDCGDVE